MSAPDTKAVPRAPVSTTPRIALSAAKSARMPDAASHISNDTALCRSGLLKISVPTPPSLRDSILSVCVIRSVSVVRKLKSHRFGGVQLRDFLVGEAELLQHLVGVLAGLARRRDELARRARQRNRLADEDLFFAVRPLRALRNAEVLDLFVGEY